MNDTFTLEQFYIEKYNWIPDNLRKEIGHFNVFRLDDFVGCNAKPIPYSRKDFFKITLLKGNNRIFYADKTIECKDYSIVFANPLIPYKLEPLDNQLSGYFCIFTEEFFSKHSSGLDYPVFKPGNNQVFQLSETEYNTNESLYLSMFDDINSDYAYKYDVLRNYIFQLVHNAQKNQPAPFSELSNSNASNRVSTMFTELLERQFPIESTYQRIKLKSPNEFASNLSLHINYLNRILKQVTGKTTSRLISERIIQEAKILLKYTNWNVSEIAFCLGFDEPAHFNMVFKKHSFISPSQFRKV